MSYRENPQIEESDFCTVTLENGDRIEGHMRTLRSINAGFELPWVLLRTDKAKPERLTWSIEGRYCPGPLKSKFDIKDFTIGYPPRIQIPVHIK